MQTNKVLLVLVGVLIGIVAVFVFGKMAAQEAYALPTKGSESFATQDFIAISSIARSDNNILWLIDTKNKKLLLYQYYNETAVRLQCVRDIQYDIDIPDAVAMPDKNAEPSPTIVKKIYQEFRKNIEKLKETEK